MASRNKTHKIQKLTGETVDVDLSHFLGHIEEIDEDHPDHGVYLQGGRQFNLDNFRMTAKASDRGTIKGE